MILAIREIVKSKTPVVKIPYDLFRTLIWAYSLIDKNPPFTTSQLKALVAPEIFEVIDWPTIFGVQATPLREALKETFLDPRYKDVILSF